MKDLYLGFGSNISERKEILLASYKKVEARIGTIVKKSEIHETEPWGYESQPPFLNSVLKIETSLSPDEVLLEIKAIEAELGRKRTIKWGPRTIDIDILFYGSEIIKKKHLTIPHPHIQERLFVLEPLKEIALNLLHPVLKKTVVELWKEKL